MWDGWGANADMGHAMCNFDILGKLLEQPKMAAGCFWNTRWMLEPNPWPGFNAFDNNNNFHPIAYSVSVGANHLYPEMVECSTDLNTLIAYSTYSRDEKAAYVYLINQGSDEDVSNSIWKGGKLVLSRVWPVWWENPVTILNQKYLPAG